MAEERFDVGGITGPRPFRIQRLGHFGLNFADVTAALPFYRDLLGFRVSDELDHRRFAPQLAEIDGIGETRGFFTRFGNDHHAFVLMPSKVRRALNPSLRSDVTINQLTWQVGSLREVVDAARWLKEKGIGIARYGRDTPGSNWHVYPLDPDGHTIELYYGIEQIGWNGRSKPKLLHRFGAHRPPDLPGRPEYLEIREVADEGADLGVGTCSLETLPARFDVGGVLLPRPFRVTGIGPVRLFVRDVEIARAFYVDTCGFTLTESVEWEGYRCHFLRVGTEHHSLALYPIALRDRLGLSAHTTCLSFGVRVNDYRQLRAAIEFLRAEGVEIRPLPAALCPGIEWSALAIDPERHAIQLYFAMEQVGWDGRTRPRDTPTELAVDEWPETIELSPALLGGEVFLGPWG